ncbi:MAG: alpha/beta hydrolase [Gammaproteobacteria bacterium]|jgi:pimeloyl-ACP methyl ester carboxylesterase|nr:alpha/beta hydrolase [Gammaproteobacteria bacterium]
MALHKKEQLHGGRAHGKPLSPSLRVMRLLFSTFGPLFPQLMGGWAYSLWFRTRRFPESAAGRRIASTAQRDTLMVDGIPVAVYSWGTGPIVLFIHGWSGRGSQVAAFTEPLLAAGFRVMAIDAPGHGATPGDRTNILECAAVLQAFNHHYGSVYGAITHSFGGMVLAYAMNNGLTVARVVVISAPAHVEYLLQAFAQTLGIPESVTADMRRRMDARFPDGYWEKISTVVNVRTLDVPALIIHDENDRSVPWEQGRIIASAWPGARFLKTSGLGHGRILRNQAVVDAAVDFINT